MSISPVARKCPSCQSENLEYGSIGTGSFGISPIIFILPTDLLNIFLGEQLFKPSAYVCLDCGTIGHYLNKKQRERLQTELAKRKNKAK